MESRASLPARSRLRNPREEAGQDQRAHDEQDQHQAHIGVGGHNSPDEDDQTGGGQDRPNSVEGTVRVGGQRIGDAAP